MKKIVSIVLLVLLLAAGCYFLCGKQKKPNVIVILIDTLRADHLSAYGYERSTSPNIDKFARDGALFKNAFSTASWTPPGTTSVLSGLYPTGHTNQPPKRLTDAQLTGIKIPQNIKLLPEVLKANGYQSAALTSNPWITKEFDFDRGFDVFYYSKHLDAKGILDRSRKSVSRFMENPEKPFFLYLHLIDPHAPYTAHPEFPFSGKLNVREYSETALADINAYDSEIAFTDAQLGSFFEFLKSKNLYDDTVIALVADHGEAFDEHGLTGHGFNLNVEEVHIPFIIKSAGLKGEYADTVSQVDLMPTILDVVGLEAPYPLAGISLRDSEKLKNRPGVYSENYRIYRQRAFSNFDQQRLIMEMGDIENPKDQMSKRGVYDLKTDQFEQKSLEDAELETELKSYLDQAIKENVPMAAVKEVEIEKGTMQTLETLGYITK